MTFNTCAYIICVNLLDVHTCTKLNVITSCDLICMCTICELNVITSCSLMSSDPEQMVSSHSTRPSPLGQGGSGYSRLHDIQRWVLSVEHMKTLTPCSLERFFKFCQCRDASCEHADLKLPLVCIKLYDKCTTDLSIFTRVQHFKFSAFIIILSVLLFSFQYYHSIFNRSTYYRYSVIMIV